LEFFAWCSSRHLRCLESFRSNAILATLNFLKAVKDKTMQVDSVGLRDLPFKKSKAVNS
jgi:hypothetical protein